MPTSATSFSPAARHNTGNSYLAIAIARAIIRNSTRGRFFNVVDLVNRLETEMRNGKQGRMADYLTRLDFMLLDELAICRSLKPVVSCYFT